MKRTLAASRREAHTGLVPDRETARLVRTIVYAAMAMNLFMAVMVAMSGPAMATLAQAAFPSMAGITASACALAGWMMRRWRS